MSIVPEELYGKRLLLTRKSLDDVDEALEAVAASFRELHQWMKWAATMPSRESLVDLTRDDDERFTSDLRWGYWIRELDGGGLVGSASLEPRGVTDELEIGYWVRSDRTGRGYATEAASILTDAAFAYVGTITTVKISMDRRNAASAAVPRKLGFARVEEYEREMVTPGHSGTGLAWVMSRSDWLSRTS